MCMYNVRKAKGNANEGMMMQGQKGETKRKKTKTMRGYAAPMGSSCSSSISVDLYVYVSTDGSARKLAVVMQCGVMQDNAEGGGKETRTRSIVRRWSVWCVGKY